jgi:hypothetical protein
VIEQPVLEKFRQGVVVMQGETCPDILYEIGKVIQEAIVDNLMLAEIRIIDIAHHPLFMGEMGAQILQKPLEILAEVANVSLALHILGEIQVDPNQVSMLGVKKHNPSAQLIEKTPIDR